MDVDYHRILSTPPKDEKKLCLHLLVANIGDKQLPWHSIRTT
jgi:hypothetical protein